MSKERICDVCGKRAAIGAKLYLTPFKEGDYNVRTINSNYTAHMDVGLCCIPQAMKFGKWTKRRKINRGVGNGKSAGTAKKKVS